MSLREAVFADYEAAKRGTVRASWLRVTLGLMLHSAFRGVFLYRLGHRMAGGQLGRRSRVFNRLVQLFSGLGISTGAEIGPGLLLPHPQAIIIGEFSVIGARARILHGVTLGGAGRKNADGQSQPRVGDDVTIGAGAVLIGPITIGDRVSIGANAVVTTDVPNDCTVAGNPARIIRMGTRRVGLLEQHGEPGQTLRDMVSRLEALEARLTALETRR
ncbi:MAG: hypothetical protein JXO22_11010 [Phycisphaerae bacterium]|nr:hypothetical protein [Phycisphaerae bacterium]